MLRAPFIFLLCIAIFIRSVNTNAQVQHGINDTVKVGLIVIGTDTLPHHWLPETIIHAKAPRWMVKALRRQRERDAANQRLRYNVYTVYPYAIAAAYIAHDVDSMLKVLPDKAAQRAFKKRKEDELNRRFKHELTNLSIQQGQILVKLIARETGKPCYEIIQEMKGGFNAAIWQAVALLFSNNLKRDYDPYDRDVDIELVVKEIEARNAYKLQE
jgi:hypothetical protein